MEHLFSKEEAAVWPSSKDSSSMVKVSLLGGFILSFCLSSLLVHTYIQLGATPAHVEFRFTTIWMPPQQWISFLHFGPNDKDDIFILTDLVWSVAVQFIRNCTNTPPLHSQNLIDWCCCRYHGTGHCSTVGAIESLDRVLTSSIIKGW